jgi:uncharacterized protein
MLERPPNLGFGLGLRIPHYAHILEHRPAVDFFEIISENFMAAGGIPLHNLDRFLESYRLVLHGVCMSLGAPGPLDMEYLKRLKALARKTKTPWFSDHLCWTKAGAHHYHDLLPLPYTDEAIRHVADKARIAQDFLEIPFGIENLSAVAEFSASRMPEWEFYRAVVEKSGCWMMLDVNNIYVSSRNHHFDPEDYVRGLDLSRVCQIHLAGHSDKGAYVLDTHDQPVREEVWELFRKVYRGCGGASTMVERDDNFLSFPETHAEVLQAAKRVSGEAPVASGPQAGFA